MAGAGGGKMEMFLPSCRWWSHTAYGPGYLSTGSKGRQGDKCCNPIAEVVDPEPSR